MLRFRRFSSRVLALLLGLLFATLGLTYHFVSEANERSALEQIRADLEVGARVFTEATAQRIEFLVSNAEAMSRDFAIRTIFLQPEIDPDTLAGALESFAGRVRSPVVAFFRADGAFLAHSDPAMPTESLRPFGELIREASASDKTVMSGFSFFQGELHVLVVVPLYAPYPNIHGWFGLAFQIDQAFAENIKRTSRVEVTFVSTKNAAQPRVLATTLAPRDAPLVAQAAAASLRTRTPPATVPLAEDRYVTLIKTQDMVGDDAIQIVLQRPLGPELAVAHELQNILLLTSLAALAVATLAALWIARGVSQPVRQLAEHTRHVAAGDYARRIELRRVDELGQLATAFNEMSAGLAERDRVRDLLDKNVSPEVAAQLLRDGAALGGQEREVTILFADLRGFTTLSEQFEPRDLLTLLNRYLDRMNGAIEREGGVIDKFIGDAIMALFGAPLPQADAADRALTAALGMERALAQLNAELAAESRPPLALGIGINTARVIAGNIGSQRRRNYSVIGDGVNVAARLQSLTRTPEYRTNIITSAATVAALRDRSTFAFRPLGLVQVKGRAAALDIFAVEQASA